MGAHQDLVQGAVVFAVAVVRAGLDGAFDTLVGMLVHGHFLLLFEFALSMTVAAGNMMAKFAFVRKNKGVFWWC